MSFVTALGFKAGIDDPSLFRRSWTVVAVARKLAVILHRMWIDETQLHWSAEG